MPELSVTLEGEFSRDGFSLTGTFATLVDDVDVTIPGTDIDVGQLAAAGTLVAGVDTGNITGTVSGLLDGIGGALGAIPGVDDLLTPLTAAIDLAGRVTSGTFGQAVEALDGFSIEEGLSGLPALEARLASLQAVRADPSIDALLQLVGDVVPGGFDLSSPVPGLGGHVDALRSLVKLVGGLMGVEAASRELRQLGELVEGMLPASELQAALRRFGALAGTDLSDLVVGIDPDDPELVRIVAQPILAYTQAVRETAAIVLRGMAFGDAALTEAGVAAIVTRLDQAAALLSESGVDAIRSLAEQLVEWAQPLLGLELPDPATSLDAMADQIVAMVAQLAAAVDSLDPARLAAPVTGGLREALGVVSAIARAAEEVTATIQNALGSVRDLIAAIDLTAVTVALRAVLDPVAQALDTVGDVIAAAQAGIDAASGAVTTAATAVRDALNTAKAAVDKALGFLQAELTKLKLEDLQQTLENAIKPVADAIAAAQLQPYFDTANDVIDTTASVVDAVPLSLLPDDVFQDLCEAIAPVQAIDFQRDVADVLKKELDEILELLDTDVLKALQEAYAKVVEFLRAIDPEPHIAGFEQATFDPLIEELRKVDPEALIRPLEEAIAPVQEAIAGFDIRATLLDPVNQALDGLQSAVQAYNPAQFIVPIENQVDELRTSATDAIRLAEWTGWLDDAEQWVKDALATLDPTVVVAALEEAFDALVAEVAGSPSGTHPVGALVTGLLQSAGIGIRVDAYETVSGWIKGLDGAAAVRGRLEDAAAALEAARDVVAGVDLRALVAQAQPNHRALAAALEAHPPGSRLRLSLDLEVATASPQALLAPALDARDRYAAVLTAVAQQLRTLAGSDRSEVTAVATALREALRPLRAFPDRLQALLGRFGLDPAGKSPRQVAAELLTTFRPSRLLQPLIPALQALIAKLEALAVQGLIAPLRAAVADLEAAIAAIDITFVREEVDALFQQVVGTVDQLRPEAVLGPTLTELEQLQAQLAAFDPLGPIRAAATLITDTIDDVDQNFRPTVLLAPVVDMYRQIVGALAVLDVAGLLQPVLDGLDVVADQLGDGLDSTAQALGRLQDALPGPDECSGGGGGSVSGSATVTI